MSTDIQKAGNTGVEKPAKNIQSLLQSDMVKGRLNEILGKKASTFATSVIQIANSNDLLRKAEPQSILNSALLATTLDLPLNNSLGFAYIVPFNNKQSNGSYQVEAQFQLGYKGFQQLAIRSGQYADLDAKKVYEGQVVVDDSFRGYHFDWKAKTSDKVIGYAAYFELHSGFSSLYYMTVEDVEKHAKRYSQTYKKGFGNWKEDFDKMAKKTVIKLLLNSGKAPLSIEMQKAVQADQSVVKDYDGEDTIDVDYVDNTEASNAQVPDDQKELQRLKDVLEVILSEEELNDLESSFPMLLPEQKELIDKKREAIKAKSKTR